VVEKNKLAIDISFIGFENRGHAYSISTTILIYFQSGLDEVNYLAR